MQNFIPYGKQWIDEDDIKAVEEVLKSDFLTQGPKIAEFEKAICRYTGAKYCVAAANGTAALHLAVLALEIKRGSEGITSPITFVASANALIYGGLRPIFADIDEKTYNIDPTEIKKRITLKTKVLIPVHFAGQSADMAEISKIAKSKDLLIIEDAAHAIGSRYADGAKIGSCGYSDMTTFSFHPVKTITTGEGGAITTNSGKLYKRLLLLRTHGITKDEKELSQTPGPWYYEMQALGYNYRLTDIQAALGISQLKKLDKFKFRRREIVEAYNKAFSSLPSITI
ncbi:MAG: aminotransferase class I/II-fold pyridoxal phosphate-dependent enzyme, partial [Candidatus Subteraquimicrobiales bacterium]|nr:aminotransferase class I/II-fold pyridoxal phosphate-dependent enzyme [Candidatus Subteraquimicrobiales bacterium]